MHVPIRTDFFVYCSHCGASFHPLYVITFRLKPDGHSSLKALCDFCLGRFVEDTISTIESMENVGCVKPRKIKTTPQANAAPT